MRFPVAGEGSWDDLVVEAGGKRLFVSRGSHVLAVDTASGKVPGDIQGTEGVHGIALAPELGHGFTSNGRSSTVSVFDLSTLAVTSTVKATCENPDAILCDASSKRVFVNIEDKNEIAVLDAQEMTVAARWPLSP